MLKDFGEVMNDNTTSEPPQVTIDNRFSMIPHWIIFSGISSGAIHLYAILQKYADGATGQAYPYRKTLASDMGKSVEMVKRHLRELTKVGALVIQQRRRPGSKEFQSSIYHVRTAMPAAMRDAMPDAMQDASPDETQSVTESDSKSEANAMTSAMASAMPASSAHGNPSETVPERFPNSPPTVTEVGSHMTLGGVAGDPVMNYTHGTTPTPLHDQSSIDPTSYTSNLRSDARKKINPGPFTIEQRQTLIDRIVDVAEAHQRDEWAWDEMDNLWDTFDEFLSDDLSNKDILGDLLQNGKWSISSKCSDRYEAGIELNKMINTAELGHLTPADNKAAAKIARMGLRGKGNWNCLAAIHAEQ